MQRRLDSENQTDNLAEYIGGAKSESYQLLSEAHYDSEVILQYFRFFKLSYSITLLSKFTGWKHIYWQLEVISQVL